MNLVHPEVMDVLVNVVKLDLLDHLDLPDPLDRLDSQESKDNAVNLDNVARLDLLDLLVNKLNIVLKFISIMSDILCHFSSIWKKIIKTLNRNQLISNDHNGIGNSFNTYNL